VAGHAQRTPLSQEAASVPLPEVPAPRPRLAQEGPEVSERGGEVCDVEKVLNDALM
jgi:hypothetical protein